MSNNLFTPFDWVKVAEERAVESTKDKYYTPNGSHWYADCTFDGEKTLTGVSCMNIAYGNGKYVAATSGGIYLSSDGKEWTKYNDASCMDCVFIRNVFIVVAGTTIYYSSNGTEFSTLTVGTACGPLHIINNSLVLSCSPTTGLYARWILVDSDGTVSFHNIGSLITRSCTITSLISHPRIWTNFCVFNKKIITTNSSNKITYLDISGSSWSLSGQWAMPEVSTGVAPNYYETDGSIIVAASNNLGLWYSSDGVTWTQSNVTSGIFYYVKYADGMWVATGQTNLYVSYDGMTWANKGTGVRNAVHIAHDCGTWLLTRGSTSSSGTSIIVARSKFRDNSRFNSNAMVGSSREAAMVVYKVVCLNGVWYACLMNPTETDQGPIIMRSPAWGMGPPSF